MMFELDFRKTADRFCGFTLLCYVVSLAAFNGDPSTALISKICLYAFFVVSLLNITVRGKVRVGYQNIAMILYAVVMGIAFFYSRLPDQAVQDLYDFITAVVLCLCVFNYLDRPEKILYAVKCFAAAGFVMCLVAVRRYGTGVFSVMSQSDNLRIGDAVAQKNLFGMYAGMSVLFSFFLLYYRKAGRLLPLYALNLVLCFIFAMFSGSKKAVLIICAGVFLLLFLTSFRKNALIKRLCVVILSVLAVLMVAYLIAQIPMFASVNGRMQEFYNTLTGHGGPVNPSDRLRQLLIQGNWDYFKQSPVWGNGLLATVYYNTLHFHFAAYSHCNYIDILANTGLIGFACYYSSYAISAYKLLRNRDEKQTRAVCLTILAVLTIVEFGVVLYNQRYFQMLFTVVCAYCSLPKERQGESLPEK